MITFLAGVVVDNYIYCSNWLSNGLYRINIEGGQSELLNVFIEEKNISNLHSDAFLYKDDIWFIPSKAEKIACFNISQNSIEYFDLPNQGRVILDKSGNYTFKFSSYQVKNTEFCWLVPVGYNLLLKLDMKRKEIKNIHGLPPEIKWSDGTINFYSGYLKENYIYMCPYESSVGIKINTKNDTIQPWGEDIGGKRYRLIIPFKSKNICIAQNVGSDISVFDAEMKEEKIEVDGNNCLNNFYLSYWYENDELIIFPFIGNAEIHIKINSMQAYTVPIRQEKEKKNYFVQRILEVNGERFLVSDRSNEILKIDKRGERSFINLEIDKKQFLNIWMKLFEHEKDAPCFEGYRITGRYQDDILGLSNYIKYIKCASLGENRKLIENIGSRIHETVKSGEW